MKFMTIAFCLVSGCATSRTTSPAPEIEAQLKLTGANSQLKAKLQMKNLSGRELVIHDLHTKYFVVQTAADNKVLEPKSGVGKALPSLKMAPGESAEVVFSLQDNYAFWDRLTKYRIAYQGPTVKADGVLVWF